MKFNLTIKTEYRKIKMEKIYLEITIFIGPYNYNIFLW